LKDRTNYPLIISFLPFNRTMFQVILADLVVLLAVIFFILKFPPKKDEPEWVELNRFRAYLRSDEFRKKHEKLIESYWKGGDKHD